ncbi:MAG: DNA methyltransferase [Prevotellaceae bacterium]|nr:DNA methyltransferase [Prevotellaceae bacterium]
MEKQDYIDKIYLGNCLEVMKKIPDNSVDMILCDLPYGVLNKSNPNARWDSEIELGPLWDEWKRIAKDNAAIVLFGQGMFSAKLMMSQPNLWRYNLVWDKMNPTGFLNANRRPMPVHEDILVFFKKSPAYHPQMEPYTGKRHGKGTKAFEYKDFEGSNTYGTYQQRPTVNRDERYPKSIISLKRKHDVHHHYHPTEKPVDLLRYLIRTYSDKDSVIMDSTMGSGSTCVAAALENRRFIGIELEKKYYDIAARRLEEVKKNNMSNSDDKSISFNEKSEDKKEEETVRLQKSVNLKAPDHNEQVLRDMLIDHLRSAGIDVITDKEEGQRVLDMAKSDIRLQSVYHGSGADFDHFDHSHVGEGEGHYSHGWGTYVTTSHETADGYAGRRWLDTSKLEEYLHEKIGVSTDISKASNDPFHSFSLNASNYGPETAFNRIKFEYKSVTRIGELYYKDENERKEFIRRCKGILDNEEKLRKLIPSKVIYSVEIPDNNGQNFIEEGNPVSKDKVDQIKNALYDYLISHDRDESYSGNAAESLKVELNGVFKHVSNGRNLYGTTAAYLGSKQAASEFLNSLGYKGIHYNGAFDGDCYVMFNDKDLKITDKVRFLKTTDGDAYGFTTKGKIYIDPKIANAETPIHEYAHLWASALRAGNRAEWDNVVSLMKQNTEVWNRVKDNYKDLKTDDEIADEVLATYSGERGARKLRDEAKKVMEGSGSQMDKSAALSALASLKEAIAKFWHAVADMLHIHYTSSEQVADQVMKDMIAGLDPRRITEQKEAEMDKRYADAVERGDFATARKMLLDKANSTLKLTLLPDDKDIEGFKYHTGEAPAKTFKRYAAFNVSPEGLKSTYAGNKEATPIGVWLDAQNLKSYMSDLTQFDDGTFATYIPGDTGTIAKTKFSKEKLKEYGLKGSTKLLLERGGKHASDIPNFSQMNTYRDEEGKKVKSAKDGALPHNKLVFEIEYGVGPEGDLTDYVKEHGRMQKGQNQGLRHIGPNQYYEFKTNPNAVGNWVIGGTFRINRLVPYDEIVEKTRQYKIDAGLSAVEAHDSGLISREDMITRFDNAANINVQKWVGGYHPEDFGLSVEKVDELYQKGLKKKVLDITYDDNGKLIPLSQRFNTEKDDLRFSLIGEKGAENLQEMDRSLNLDVAKDMDSKGIDSKNIWLSTGWEKGVDGKWRSEIPDIRLHKDVDLKKVKTLGDLIADSELFRAYPQLKDTLVRFGAYSSFSGEETLEKGKEVIKLNKVRCLDFKIDDANKKELVNHAVDEYIDNCIKKHRKTLPSSSDIERVKFNAMQDFASPSLNDYGKSVLIHEIQHAIQRIEGFARGGLIKNFKKDKETGKIEVADKSYEDAKTAYKSLVGEVEARNAQRRMDLSPEERKNTPPSLTEDIARDKQIIKNGQGSFRMQDHSMEKKAEFSLATFFESVKADRGIWLNTGDTRNITPEKMRSFSDLKQVLAKGQDAISFNMGSWMRYLNFIDKEINDSNDKKVYLFADGDLFKAYGRSAEFAAKEYRLDTGREEVNGQMQTAVSLNLEQAAGLVGKYAQVTIGEKSDVINYLHRHPESNFDRQDVLGPVKKDVSAMGKGAGIGIEYVMRNQAATYDPKQNHLVLSGVAHKPAVILGYYDDIRKATDLYRAVIAATGSKDRLNRENSLEGTPADRTKYEHLVEEISAGMLMARHGMPAAFSRLNLKDMDYWAREAREDPWLESRLEWDVNTAIGCVDKHIAGETVDYDSLRAKDSRMAADGQSYKVNDDLDRIPNANSREVVIIRDTKNNSADVLLPQGASVFVENELPGIKRDELTKALKEKGIQTVNFYNSGGAEGLRKPDEYFKDKIISYQQYGRNDISNSIQKGISTWNGSAATERSLPDISRINTDRININKQGRPEIWMAPDKYDHTKYTAGIRLVGNKDWERRHIPEKLYMDMVNSKDPIAFKFAHVVNIFSDILGMKEPERKEGQQETERNSQSEKTDNNIQQNKNNNENIKTSLGL